MTTAKTTCPYCGVGCGVLANPQPDGTVAIKGDPDHPANFGRLCSKGLALGETLSLSERLLYPEVNDQRTSWDKATALVAEKFSAAIAEHGPDSVAFYISGQFLTEDYYVANKLVKGFIGSANIDTNSRLCMASAVAGHKRAFGADVVPCNYKDLEEADLVVLVGSNLAWCHPVLFQRLQAAREKRGTKVVVIDPRRSATAEAADLHLAIASQSDVALFNGLFRHLYSAGQIDGQFIHRHTENFSATLMAANEWSVAKTAEACGLTISEVEEFFALFARYEKVVTAFSMGVNQSTSGTDKVNAIINCHLLTGRISKAGAGPFSITGQPNAMGGREVGGLANMLAAHLDIENADHREAVQTFWHSPRMAVKPGLKAVDLFQAVRDGRIKALWIMATNPVVSMPDSTGVTEALKACPFVVVSDVTANTDTTRLAQVKLPALGWGEKDGTVTNSERTISRQRGFLPVPGEARADWRIMADVAKAMGFDGFDYASPAEIFAEHVRLTQLDNDGSRKLDLTAWVNADYEKQSPQQWGGARPFEEGRFQTPSGKARFVATTYVALPTQNMTLNSGRIRDQWHTMTRTGLAPKLFAHRAEPYIEINPQDATRLGLAAAEIVEVSSGPGKSLARALITDAVKPGSIFQPMHWNGSFANASLANASSKAQVDPVSGQPALKSASVNVQRFAATWYGFGISVRHFTPEAAYCAWRPINRGMAFECAGSEVPKDWGVYLYQALGAGGEVTSLQSHDSKSFRCAVVKEGRLVFAFVASAVPVEVSRDWLQSRLGQKVNTLEVLAGRPQASGDDQGAILCACNAVGVKAIGRFIHANPTADLEAICNGTRAGTGCGSCRIEIRRIMHEAAKPLAAAE
jgi:assimilatory nitrate reductase catalytic subunit